MVEYKIVVLGSSGVGKSAVNVKFVTGAFVDRYDPAVQDSYKKTIEIDGVSVSFEIIEPACETFTAMRDIHLKEGHGFLLVFSIVNRSSFLDTQEMRDDIVRVKDTDDFPCVLVGNKSDLSFQRQVPTEDGINLANKYLNCSYIEASAKNNGNIEEVFTALIRTMLDKYHPKLRETKKKKEEKKDQPEVDLLVDVPCYKKCYLLKSSESASRTLNL